MLSLLRPERRHALELLDTPAQVSADLPANLADIRRLNRWFGGAGLVCHHIHEAFLTRGPHSVVTPAIPVISLLDVATGSADIPLALVRWGARHDLDLRVVALDSSREVLEEAARVVGDAPVGLVRGDARALPWPDRSFDVVTCSLALHHFEPDGAAQVLREMARVARNVLIVVDLRRTYLAYIGTWLATHVFARNRLTRHDGPLSVLRAYTADEMTSIARDAGLAQFHIRRRHFFRLVLVWHRRPSDGR
jgi:SAM-dependent methyltransferase